jgi:hypothetical protein
MNSAIEYRISLKYVKKSTLPVKRTQKLAEFVPVFIARKNGKEERIPGKAEARAKVFLPEFLNFAKKVGAIHDEQISLFQMENDRSRKLVLKVSDDYAYLRLMIYGVLMSVLKNPVEWGYLEDLVLSMEPLTLRFWGSKIKYTFWKAKNRRVLNYLARRILEVERLGKVT